MDGVAELFVYCDGAQLGSLRSRSFHRITCTLPFPGRAVVRSCAAGWDLRRLQRKLDAGYEDYCAAGEFASGMAGKKGSADQRFALGSGAQW